VGGVVAVGQQDQGVIDAQLGAPLVEGQAELVVEQPAERAGAGAGQRGVVPGLVVEQLGEGSQPVIARLWQPQRLLEGHPELVDEDPAQAGAGGAVQPGAVPS
jgi:hypothetical protein